MKIKIIAALTALTLLASCGEQTATTTETKPASEATISAETATPMASDVVTEDGRGANAQARKEAFNAMLEEFSLMGKMVKGEIPYDAESFKTTAAAFAQKSLVPFEHFQQDGAGLNGDAKDNIWTDTATFQADVAKFKTAVHNLNEAAANNTDVNKIKPEFAAVAATCKSCHDTFRK